MQPFKLTLSNGTDLCGRYNLPTISSAASKYRPLIVGIHGGTFSASYFDANEKYTATLSSNALSVPFVAISRPCYGGTTSIFPLPVGLNYHHVVANWIHSYALPAVWAEFGKPNSCNSIVLLAHSMGAISMILAAAMYSGSKIECSYPLSGIIVAGLGMQVPVSRQGDAIIAAGKLEADPTTFSFAPERQKTLMLGGEETRRCETAMHQQMDYLQHPTPLDELGHVYELQWFTRWREFTGSIHVPVLVVFAERDEMCVGTRQHLAEFMSGFTSSLKVDGNFIPGAPHCLELSNWSQGYYANCFGWAIECAVTYEFDLVEKH
jgi:pimeloyl-ACP methyl ester carboxylesterase